MEDTRFLSVRLDGELNRRLKDHAAQLGRTPSDVVRSLLAATLSPAQEVTVSTRRKVQRPHAQPERV